ncbi:MAG: hypothetical protein AAF348_14590, partial [Bacteroidota bacterium]
DWITTTTHHDLHHSSGHNFGFYFTWFKNYSGKTKLDMVLKSYNWLVKIGGLGALVVFFTIILVFLGQGNYVAGIVIPIASFLMLSIGISLLRYDLKVFKSELLEILHGLENKNLLQHRV